MDEARPADPRLLEAALAATRRLDPRGCLEELARGALGLLGGAWALGYLLGDSGEDLECVAAAGRREPADLARDLPSLDAGLIWHLAPHGPAVLEQARVLLAENASPGLGEQLGPGLLIPLGAGGGCSGLLLVVAAAGERFEDGAVERGSALAREAAPALDNLRTVASLRELVIRDDTADCYNRRYLDHTLEDEVERARRFGGRLAVIFLDMDNLKEVNTAHGHAAGSRVLYEASVRIGASIRSIDKLFRYGGDEFVIILPGTGPDGAREVAERVRRELADFPFTLPSGVQAAVSASSGIAAWPEHGPAGRAVVAAADNAMRAVKFRGKNSVGMAPAPGAGDAAAR